MKQVSLVLSQALSYFEYPNLVSQLDGNEWKADNDTDHVTLNRQL